MKLLRLTIYILLCGSFAFAADDGRVKVISAGQSPADTVNARQSAIEDALRQAVETGGGLKVASQTEVRDFELVKDIIYLQSAGLVENYKVLRENPNQGGFYTVEVEAIVSRAEIDTNLAVWKALIARKGHPRLLIVGSADKQAFDFRLTAELQGILEKRNLDVIDLEMLNENQRRDAERAAKGDLDPGKAALIIRELGADYFVIAQVTGTQYPAKTVHGLQMYPVEATAILKVVAADNGAVIASEVVDHQTQGPTQQQATNQACSFAINNAMEKVFGRIACHWIEDVDVRSGQEIALVLARFPFSKVEHVVRELEKVDRCEVVIDATDIEGRSHLRVITNESSAFIVSVLTRIVPEAGVIQSSKYKIELDYFNAGSNESKSFKLIFIVVGMVLVILALVNLFRLNRKG
ncbi:MAG: hypothetical protein JEZ07_04780 [Phycisphaerae bacterium]|nr:hypothetical protein [Phycisphaerae bacterium]